MGRKAILRWLILVGMTAATVGSGCQSFAFKGIPTRLRLLTYNTALLSAPIIGELNDSRFGMGDEERASIIADRILADDSDVVVLNEVFDEFIAHQIKQKLAPKYSSWVQTIDCNAVSEKFFTEGDSGLMVFSKHPFVEFSPDASPFWQNLEHLNAMSGGTNWWDSQYKVPIVMYTDCSGDDCLASKAVAMVRMQHTETNLPFSVAFTHTQASYHKTGSDDVESEAARRRQMLYIRWLITSSLTAQQTEGEPVFVLGDLNVEGGNAGTLGNNEEWIEYFDTSGEFFSAGDNVPTFNPASGIADPWLVDPLVGTYMTDSWGFETSKTDPGITNADDNARLDYILHNKPSHSDRADLCMQHIAIAWELGQETSEGWKDYSDHLGVRADFNGAAPHCSANDDAGILGPQQVVFGKSQNVSFGDLAASSLTEIHYPGSMQWYRIDHAGSYQIEIGSESDDKVDYAIYHHRELSRPIWSYHEENDLEFGARYSLPDPPYYVRVVAKERSWTGKYTIHFHENVGRTSSDSIALTANARMPYYWPGATTVPAETPDTKIWFHFYTDVAASGVFPETILLQDNLATSDLNLYGMDIVSNAEPVPGPGGELVYEVMATYSGEIIENPYTSSPVLAFATGPLAGNSTGPRKYYARLWRDPWVQGNEYLVYLTFGTTLTYFRPLKLTAQDAWDDDPSDDQLDLRFIKDETVKATNSGPSVELEFDSDQERPLSGFAELSGSFARNIVLNLSEEDEYMYPTYWLHYKDIMNVVGPEFHNFGLNATGLPEEGEMTWKDAGNIDDADYWYEVIYLTSSEVFPKCADAPGSRGCIPW